MLIKTRIFVLTISLCIWELRRLWWMRKTDVLAHFVTRRSRRRQSQVKNGLIWFLTNSKSIGCGFQFQVHFRNMRKLKICILNAWDRSQHDASGYEKIGAAFWGLKNKLKVASARSESRGEFIWWEEKKSEWSIFKKMWSHSRLDIINSHSKCSLWRLKRSSFKIS